jgi:cobyrinic acid a,c-diamide synthase
MTPIRLVIAGAGSSVGKTTVSILVSNILKNRGYKVQTFKVGPDYIDPSYHSLNTGRICRNLDGWMVPRRHLLEIIDHASEGSDAVVIEGVMGLFDGISGLDETGSTAQIAKITKSPLLLVVDVQNIARTAAAVVLGFNSYDRKIRIGGVILNGIASEAHAKWCKESIMKRTGIPVVGALPKILTCSLPERHLGLIPTPEKKTLKEMDELKILEQYLDADRIIEIGKTATPLPICHRSLFVNKKKIRARIGVAYDEAFNFYYQDNLDLLAYGGAEIEYFSPLKDKKLPDVDGFYLGGGFPEVYSKQLASNEAMRKCIKSAAEDETPIYAECGGLMYLTSSITSFEGDRCPMAGFLYSETVMEKKLTLNYTLAKVVGKNALSKVGAQMKGHEFHFSHISEPPPGTRFAYDMKIGVGIDGKHDGWLEKKVLASYMHLNFASNPKLAERFVDACAVKK